MIKTSELDETMVSPNRTTFFMRPYRLRKEMAALKMLVTEFTYSASKDTEAVAVRSARGGITQVVGTGEDENTMEFSSPQAVSVAAADMFHTLFNDGELVEIWEIQTDIQADGKTIFDNNGELVKEGMVRDYYGVGKITEFEHENNAGDPTITENLTITMPTTRDSSWVDASITEQEKAFYPNASLKKFEEGDNPKNTVRTKYADKVDAEVDPTQTADVPGNGDGSNSDSDSDSQSKSKSESESISKSESISESLSNDDSKDSQESQPTRKSSKK